MGTGHSEMPPTRFSRSQELLWLASLDRITTDCHQSRISDFVVRARLAEVDAMTLHILLTN